MNVMPDSVEHGADRELARAVRVAHLVPRFCLGGMEQGVAKIVNGLKAPRVCSLICSFETTEPPRPLVRPDVPVHELGQQPGNDPRIVLRLARWLKRSCIDIVHSHSWGTLVEGYTATRLARVPVFIHGEHGTMELRRRNLWVQRWLWGRANRVLAVSSRLGDRMTRETGFPRQRIMTIRNGTDLERFGSVLRDEARAAEGLSVDEFVVGTVGRLVPVKDQRTLIASVADLSARSVPVTGLIVGDGPLREQLASCAASSGVADKIRFLGHRADVERILPALDVYVQTSVSEGLPNTVLEAMASGVAVIATDVGGTDELVTHGKSGLLIPAGSSDVLSNALHELFNDAARRRDMGCHGRMTAASEFDLPKMIRSYEALYLSMACEHVNGISVNGGRS